MPPEWKEVTLETGETVSVFVQVGKRKSMEIGRKLVYKRRTRWFLLRAVQQAIKPQSTTGRAALTTADILAQWDAEGMGDSWASRTDIGDSSAYARQLRETAQRRERNG